MLQGAFHKPIHQQQLRDWHKANYHQFVRVFGPDTRIACNNPRLKSTFCPEFPGIRRVRSGQFQVCGKAHLLMHLLHMVCDKLLAGNLRKIRQVSSKDFLCESCWGNGQKVLEQDPDRPRFQSPNPSWLARYKTTQC